MTIYYVRNDRSAIPILQKEETLGLIEDRAKRLHASDPGYTAALTDVIEQVVSERSKFYRWSTIDTRILLAELADLSVSRLSMFLQRHEELKARKAASALEDAKGIFGEEDTIFRGFNRVNKADAVAKPEEVLAVVRGLGRLAASLGAPRAADGWYAREISTTVEGERSDVVGQYKKRARPFMMPFAEVRSLTPTDVENKLLQKVLRDNRQGIEEALHAIVRALPAGKDVDATSRRKTFLMPSAVLNRANLLGSQLGTFRESADRLQRAPLETVAELLPVMQDCHRAYVARNYAQNLPTELRHGFEDLDPKHQRRNIAPVLGALYGLVQANRLVGEVLERGILLGDGSPTEAGNDLQLHLVSCASQAMSMDFQGANAMFSGAVADEIGLLLAFHNRAPDRLSEIHDAVESVAAKAGGEFDLGGKRDQAGPGIALDGIGRLMKVIDPENDATAAEWRKRAEDVLARARVEDLVGICQENFRIGELPKGKEMIAALKEEIDPNDFFYKQIDRLQARGDGEKGLSEGDRALLRNLLYLANATWKVGQVHRAIGESDLSRINPSERDRVFNPYDAAVTAAGSDLKSFFVVAKDLLVLKG
jgi:hypothetical protein